MPYVRTVKTSSGATAVQIVYSYHRGSRQIEHIGSAHDDAELELLKAVPRQRLAAGQGELELGLDTAAPGGPLPITGSRMSCLLDAVLDWECGPRGRPRRGLAWCEWVVRMHHSRHVGRLGEFFDGYSGPIPPWPDRHAFMIDSCRSLHDLCRQQEPGGRGEAQWAHRLAVTAAWQE